MGTREHWCVRKKEGEEEEKKKEGRRGRGGKGTKEEVEEKEEEEEMEGGRERCKGDRTRQRHKDRGVNTEIERGHERH